MNSSLYTGVLGLKNHQTKMDVIGNNISNVSTYGFKKGRATFADLLSRTYTGASAPRDGIGGTNPLQVGLGMTTVAVTNIMTQGQTETTGRLTDVAIDGNGWFVLESASGQDVYTRDGAFQLDKEGSLVSADGYYVQGWTRVEVDNDHNFTVDTQRPVTDIQFQYGQKLAAQATNEVGLKCNLDSSSRSLIADGIDPKEGFATKNDLLVDLYDDDGVDPQHLGIREGDWIEIHVDTNYVDRTLPLLGGTSTLNITSAGTTVTYGANTVNVYSGLFQTSELPLSNITAPAGWTRVYDSPAQIAAGAANRFSIDENSGVIYAKGSMAATSITYNTQQSALSTSLYENNKYLYFQVTNDTTVGNLESAIQNALDALDVNGTMNPTVSFDTDTATFIIYNNSVDGSHDYNDLHVEINAVSGSGIREGYLLRESTYPTLTGTRLGVTAGGLGGAMGREQVADFDYQTNQANLDYGNIDGSAQIYGQVVRTRLQNTTYAGGGTLNVATAGDWTGYTGNNAVTGAKAYDLQMMPNTAELSVDGTIWTQVSVFTGAANEYRISSSVAGSDVPAVVFNTLDANCDPQNNATIVFSYRTQNADNKLLIEGTDYTIDATSGNISFIWSASTAGAQLGGADTTAASSCGFTGTVRLTADYTTEDRSLTPPSEIMNSRWADFAQEWAEVSSGGDGKARTNFNNMFSPINSSRNNGALSGVVADQATSTQPTSVSSSRLQSAEVYRTSIDVYDSLGDTHTLQFVFTHVGSNYDTTNQIRYQNRWYWRAELPYDDTFSFDSMDNADNSATARLTGELTFDDNGLLIPSSLGGNVGPIVFDPSPVGANGASTHATDTVAIELNIDGGGSLIDGITQYASDFTTRAFEQNGWAMGTLDTFSIDSKGVIQGTYSNNVVKPIAQIALAMFANQEGLEKLGGNVFGLSANSGLAQVVAANVAGAGSMVGGALEQSNVDIVEEFASMIITERGFQANSRIITTSDEMLTEVINLKR